MNVTGCTILDCDHAGLLLREVSHSRVSGCLIRNDRTSDAPWNPLQAVGGSGNQIVDNLVDAAR